MKCQTCGAALGRGTAAHHLTCRYCGAVHSDPVTPERRPFEDALDAALDETGAISGNTSRALDAFEVEGQCYSSTAEVPPDVRAAIDDASQALDDIFGGPPMKTHMVAASGAAAQKTIAAASAPAETVREASPPRVAQVEPAVAVAPSASLEETAPMPPVVASEIVAAAQAHSHADVSVTPEPESKPARESQIATAPPATAERPAPSRVTMASDPVPVEQPAWMQHAVAITTIAVIAVFTAAGIAIVVLH